MKMGGAKETITHFSIFIIAVALLSLAPPTYQQLVVTPIPVIKLPRVCEPLREITLCQGIEMYTNVSFPNIREHQTQLAANQELEQFIPLIEVGCSNAIIHFLCAIYAPFCQYNRPEIEVAPCRELCQYVFDGCESILRTQFNLEWPPHLECDNFLPDSQSDLDFCPRDPRNLTIGNSTVTIRTHEPTTPTPDVRPPIGATNPTSTNPTSSVSPNSRDPRNLTIGNSTVTIRTHEPTTPTPDVRPPIGATNPTSTNPTSSVSPNSLKVTSSLRNKSYSFRGIGNCGVKLLIVFLYCLR